MSIPASYIETLRDRVSIAETIGRRISFDPKKSLPGKGDYWACCPFHGEKTPSFHVLDRQGYFYCFGCHEKGSAIDFVMKHDNLSFPEAVEALALEVGMAPPVKDRREARREQKRATLSEVTEAAAAFFRDQLDSAAGRAARAYLSEKRGLTRETIERFEIGFAPDGWDGAVKALGGQGFDPDLLIGADICARSDRDGSLFDRFRNRIMFPIRDERGRCVAFGGRALAPHAKAKYLNSRETDLFKKSRTLYNFGRARGVVSAENPLVVVEGYMDVISLAQAGFETAVAPMGTALTEQQLETLWKVSDQPVLMLDGDKAGSRAAERTAVLALSKLSTGKSLAFAMLPPGSDPDDVLKKSGPLVIDDKIKRSKILVDFLFLFTQRDFSPLMTPDQRTALEKTQMDLVDLIQDKRARHNYSNALWERRLQLFQQLDKEAREKARRRRRVAGPTAGAMSQAIEGSAASDDPFVIREGAILVLLLENPGLWDERRDLVEELEFIDPALDNMKSALLSGVAAIDDQRRDEDDDQTEQWLDPSARYEALTQYVDERCGAGACAQLRDSLKKRLGGPFTKPSQSLHAVCRLFDEVVRFHDAQLTERREKEAYNAELLDPAAEDVEPLRVREAQKRVVRSQGDLSQEDAENAGRSGRLSALVDGEIWVKRRGRGAV